METFRLRQVWSIIETIQTDLLLDLDRVHLSHLLIEKIQQTLPLSQEENHFLRVYIHSKIPLIWIPLN